MCASTADRRRVVVRADASAEIGLGHVVRSIALAEELAVAGWSVVVCGSGIPAGIAGNSIEIVETAPVPDPAPVLGLLPDLVVVDGYHFTAAFFAEIERAGVRYAVIDDNVETPARRPAAVINQNPHADAAMYAHLEGDPPLLLGTEFTLLRREVVEAARRPDPPSRSSNVLVAFGGSDPRRLTAPVAAVLTGAGFDVRVAIGAAHPDRPTVVAALDDRQIAVIAPGDYVTELATAGVSVLAAGSSVWEAACLGAPTVAVEVAPNQHGPMAAAREQGLVRAVLIADDRLLTALPPVVASILDSPDPAGPAARPSAAGAQRVAQALGALVTEPLRLRAATMADAAFLFGLRTDPDVDRQSAAPAPTWESHLSWLAATIDDPACRLLIVEAGTRSIGQLRLDDVDDDHVVSVALVEQARGCGIGPRAIGIAQSMASGDLVARIKVDNAASRAVFASAGFRSESDDDELVVMRWRRTPDSRGVGVNGAGVNGAGVNGAGVNGAGVNGAGVNGFRIAGRPIGPAEPPYVIAEISANHRGSRAAAIELIEAAAAAGADAVKLQHYTAETITVRSDHPDFEVRGGTLWDGRQLADLYAEAMTPWEWTDDLAAAAEAANITWFSTPFDPTAIEFLLRYDVPAFKIASFEIVDLPLIRAAAATGKPLIVSTGMATADEIDAAVGAVSSVGGEAGLALLRCNSSYPAPADEMDLRAIPAMAERWRCPVGLSDHTIGSTAAIASVALGACIIEKHLTLHRADGGPDAAFSAEPAELAALVADVREAQTSLGTARFGPSEHEAASLAFRRSLRAVRPIAAGSPITANDVRSVRPAGGLAPDDIERVIGAVATHDLAVGDPITWENIEVPGR